MFDASSSSSFRSLPLVVALVFVAALLVAWWSSRKPEPSNERSNKHSRKLRNIKGYRNNNHKKKNKQPSSKAFRPVKNQTSIFIIDVNNVRGIYGFQYSDIGSFCDRIHAWAEQQQQRLHILLAVDHGPKESVYDFHCAKHEIAIAFAGTNLTADDTIVEAVALLSQNFQTIIPLENHHATTKLLVVTADRQLRHRCRDANQTMNMGFLTPAVLAEWLDDTQIGTDPERRRRRRHTSFHQRKSKGYETTREREHQALVLWNRLEFQRHDHIAASRIASWSWWSRLCFVAVKCGVDPQESSSTTTTNAMKRMLEDWLEQKETQRHNDAIEAVAAGKPSADDIRVANYRTKRESMLKRVTQDMKHRYVAMDCEMVGVGKDGVESALARVSIVDWDLNILLDAYVKVPVPVTDYRTVFSGIEPHHISAASSAMGFKECQRLVADILQDKILVGHGLSNDLRALQLTHAHIRDTTRYKPFKRQHYKKRYRARRLRDLVRENIPERDGFQEGAHDSVEDARAVMELYQLVWETWELEVSRRSERTGSLLGNA